MDDDLCSGGLRACTAYGGGLTQQCAPPYSHVAAGPDRKKWSKDFGQTEPTAADSDESIPESSQFRATSANPPEGPETVCNQYVAGFESGQLHNLVGSTTFQQARRPGGPRPSHSSDG